MISLIFAVAILLIFFFYCLLAVGGKRALPFLPLMVLLFAHPVAGESWTGEEIGTEIAWQSLNLIDMGQALDDHGWNTQGIGHGRIHKDHLAWAFGGPNIDRSLIPVVAVGAGFTHFFISSALPAQPRKWFQRITLGLWLSGVLINARW